MTIKPFLYPKGGWWFSDANDVVHTGKSLTSLVKIVQEYRRINGMPAGNPLEEVSAQICKRQPTMGATR